LIKPRDPHPAAKEYHTLHTRTWYGEEATPHMYQHCSNHFPEGGSHGKASHLLCTRWNPTVYIPWRIRLVLVY
jgi:hypothetical protein